jgi:hypothetical protein
MKQLIASICQKKEHFVCRQTGAELLLIPLKDNVADFNQYLTLNEVGSFIWENMSCEDDETSLVSKICVEFDADEQLVKKDVMMFLPKLHQFVIGA